MIIASAIKFYLKDNIYPIVMTGMEHCDIYEQMYNLGINYEGETDIQGFWTDDQQFLNRIDAKIYALKIGQLIEDTGRAELYSEDLW